ncbi:DUF1016 N-terminal domain-containing protein [Flavobacterium frigidarium]|uniref:DUF1016 N-terminal domain-containing protein n=1 Tax=Flavobacterium frigidarium TaxID=99286 RepID=UPI00374235F7
MKGLSTDFTKEFGKGFSRRNLEQIRKFFKTYSNSSSLSTILIESILSYLSLKNSNIPSLVNTKPFLLCKVDLIKLIS